MFIPPTILQFFEYEHLPPKLQEVSKPFGELARWMVQELPGNAERDKALDKLLEAKDAAVRARLSREPSLRFVKAGGGPGQIREEQP